MIAYTHGFYEQIKLFHLPPTKDAKLKNTKGYANLYEFSDSWVVK
jgi:hypothetical protein